MGAVLRSAIFLGLANLAVEGFAGANFDETICRATVSVDAEATLKEAFRKASWYAFRPADGSGKTPLLALVVIGRLPHGSSLFSHLGGRR